MIRAQKIQSKAILNDGSNQYSNSDIQLIQAEAIDNTEN
jgi:hypothetical protein